jgi:hypothetical protein
MEVEDRIDEEEGTLDLNDVKFEMKVEDERMQRDDEEDFMYENPYALMDNLKSEKNSKFGMSVSVTHKTNA